MSRFEGEDCLHSATGRVLEVEVVLGGVATTSMTDQQMLSALSSVSSPLTEPLLIMALDQVRLFRNRSLLFHLRIGCALHHYSVSCQKACTGPKFLTSICCTRLARRMKDIMCFTDMLAFFDRVMYMCPWGGDAV